MIDSASEAPRLAAHRHPEGPGGNRGYCRKRSQALPGATRTGITLAHGPACGIYLYSSRRYPPKAGRWLSATEASQEARP